MMKGKIWKNLYVIWILHVNKIYLQNWNFSIFLHSFVALQEFSGIVELT
jgi:hypothetical protein